MDEEKRNYYLGDIDQSNMDPEHIGLLNMRLRLSYLYQEKFDFQIECPKDGGTSVIIRLYK
jgi:sensor histidine kinase YesM